MSEYLITSADLSHPSRKMGLVPRDYNQYPVGYLACAKPFDLPLMTDDEIEAAIRRKDADGSWLDDIRNRGKFGSPIPSLDQDGVGYCWCHSGISGHLLVRALNNLPFVDLSPFFIGCLIKGYRDEGGWGSEGVEFQAANGCCTSQFWAQQSMRRSNDTAAARENAKLHRISEWMDLDPRNVRQLATCLCSDIPVVSDFNWWRHSVCTVRLIRWGGGRNIKTRIWNSWGDSWKQNGMGDLEGSQAIPDGQIAPRVVYASVV